MDSFPIRLFRDAEAVLAESLWWDATAAALRWLDITAGTLHTSPLDGDIGGGDDTVMMLEPPVSAFQPAAGGGFVVAMRDRIVLTDDAAESPRTLAVVEHAHAGLRLNEGKCDPFGRFVVGSMNVTTGEPDGAVYAVEADGALRLLAGGFGVANGVEWSEDGTTMFLTDTSVSTVYRADYGVDGSLGELEPLLVGRPSDGLALDADGFFWNGLYGEGVVVRWTPDGRIDREIEIPAPNVTSVAFGGAGLRSLFVATARENLSEGQLEAYPASGAVFVVDTESCGRPVNRFGAAPFRQSNR